MATLNGNSTFGIASTLLTFKQLKARFPIQEMKRDKPLQILPQDLDLGVSGVCLYY